MWPFWQKTSEIFTVKDKYFANFLERVVMGMHAMKRTIICVACQVTSITCIDSWDSTWKNSGSKRYSRIWLIIQDLLSLVKEELFCILGEFK